MAPHPALEREQPKNHQRAYPELRVRDRRPRQDAKNNVGDQGYCQAIHCSSKDPSRRTLRISPAGSLLRSRLPDAQLWCTGKDSNLRTSLGGTDLQSVGFNHSPTCANCKADHGLIFPANCRDLRHKQTSIISAGVTQKNIWRATLPQCPIGKFSMEVAVG